MTMITTYGVRGLRLGPVFVHRIHCAYCLYYIGRCKERLLVLRGLV